MIPLKMSKVIIVFIGLTLRLYRAVKLARADNISYGGLTTVNDYHLIPKNESVVDSVFMHDNFAPLANKDESAMVVVTNDHVYSLADDWSMFVSVVACP